MKLFSILGVVFTIYPIWGCSEQIESKPLNFISMALPNRPGNIPHAHDQNCQGFLKNDFNVVGNLSKPPLKWQEEIKWQNL